MAFTSSYTDGLIQTSEYNYGTPNMSISGLTVSGSLTTINYISGALLTPTSSGIPVVAGDDGQYMFGSGSAGYFICVYLGGAWRTGSLG